MEEKYIREKLILNLTTEQKNNDIVRNIINTRKELNNANKNFEFAYTDELIDFYIFRIKSIQAKLNNLIKVAKIRNIDIKKIA